ncbi:MAG: transcriptional regulator, LacI family [Blastococcus sp.]|nr:transcriptional regulator, LacI family [Blastococcus sp.]
MTSRRPTANFSASPHTLPAVAPRPTLRDVATAAGVHPATASRALNEATRVLVRPATVERVREVAAALGYQVNPIARSLKTSRSETVGVLVPDLTNPLFPPIVRGIEDALAEAGYTALTANTDNDPARTASSFAVMQARQVDGFIIATALLDDPLVHEAAQRGVPMVLVNRQTEHLDASVVAGDDATGIARTIDHLVELGHRDIAHVAGPLTVSTGAVRLRAFRSAMQHHGLPDDRIVVADSYSEAAGRTAALELLAGQPPTAVVAGNDLLAIGCYDALEESGLRCPDDVSVVGFNDMPLVSRLRPPLTSVRVPQYELGVEAARLLLDRLSGRTPTARVVLLPVSLVVRGSTAPPSR